MKRLLLLVGLLFVLSCGSGGDNVSNPSSPEVVTPPSQDMIGTYTFNSLRGKYSDGSTFTEKNYTSVSGVLIIGLYEIEQYMAIDGNNDETHADYTVCMNGNLEGYFHLRTLTTERDLSFVISGNYLITYTGELSAGGGRTVEQWVTWEKIHNYANCP